MHQIHACSAHHMICSFGIVFPEKKLSGPVGDDELDPVDYSYDAISAESFSSGVPDWVTSVLPPLPKCAAPQLTNTQTAFSKDQLQTLENWLAQSPREWEFVAQKAQEWNIGQTLQYSSERYKEPVHAKKKTKRSGRNMLYLRVISHFEAVYLYRMEVRFPAAVLCIGSAAQCDLNHLSGSDLIDSKQKEFPVGRNSEVNISLWATLNLLGIISATGTFSQTLFMLCNCDSDNALRLFERDLAVYLRWRDMGWFVRDGLKFGGRFVAYEKPKDQVHSRFVLCTILSSRRDASFDMRKLLRASRLAAGSNKSLILSKFDDTSIKEVAGVLRVFEYWSARLGDLQYLTQIPLRVKNYAVARKKDES